MVIPARSKKGKGRQQKTTPPPPVAGGGGENGGGRGTLGYEKCRDERIRENLERMQKLGILDLALALKLKSDHHLSASSSKRPYNRKTPTPQAKVFSPRRSSRW